MIAGSDGISDMSQRSEPQLAKLDFLLNRLKSSRQKQALAKEIN